MERSWGELVAQDGFWSMLVSIWVRKREPLGHPKRIKKRSEIEVKVEEEKHRLLGASWIDSGAFVQLSWCPKTVIFQWFLKGFVKIDVFEEDGCRTAIHD